MEKKNAVKRFLRMIGVAIVIGAIYTWVANITPGPKYIEEAGVFFIPATSEWSDADIYAATTRLVHERRLRIELAQLLEQNAGK